MHPKIEGNKHAFLKLSAKTTFSVTGGGGGSEHCGNVHNYFFFY